MSRATGVAKQQEYTHAGARIPTSLYRRVTSKVAAEGGTLRQLIIDCFNAYLNGEYPPPADVNTTHSSNNTNGHSDRDGGLKGGA